jgi:dTDP-4-dehydrorhamnose reductase
MKIIVSGAGGQVGRALVAQAAQPHVKYSFVFLTHEQLDITDAKAVQLAIEEHQPNAWVNAAAYTAVDKAEQEEEQAFAINATAPGLIAKACCKADVALLHISTDFVFDGHQSTPYLTSAERNPIGNYGRSKAAGENNVLSAHPNACIVRTAWVYAPWGNNFLHTILRLGAERKELTIVADQVGSPTYAPDLADFIISWLNTGTPKGIYHFTNEGVCSWYDFAHAIAELQGLSVNVLPIRTEDYPTPARRPAYSVLDKTNTRKDFDIQIRHWRDALKDCLTQLT